METHLEVRQAAVVMSDEKRRCLELEKNIPARVPVTDSLGLCVDACSMQAFTYLYL